MLERRPSARVERRGDTMITEAINVVDAVDEAIPVVRQHVQEIHDCRRLPDAVVDALRATGINRMVLATSKPPGSTSSSPIRTASSSARRSLAST
jgi:hypothetical protein